MWRSVNSPMLVVQCKHGAVIDQTIMRDYALRIGAISFVFMALLAG
mgnify:FL=1